MRVLRKAPRSTRVPPQDGGLKAALRPVADMEHRVEVLLDFVGPGRTAALRVLADATGPLTGRQIADIAGLSPAGAARALDRLAELGVTRRRPVGRAVLHELDRASALVSRIILFGSRARGDSDANSDFDLLVVLPEVTDRHATAVAMLVALGHLAVPVDVIPADAAEIAAHDRSAGTALAAALRAGEVVYERVA